MSVSIILADDHMVVRQGLRALLGAQADFEVIAETSDGLETVQKVEEMTPDVLVLDLGMPSLHGLEVLTHVTARSPETNVVVLSMYADESYVLRALKDGARGYVVKTAEASELVDAIQEAAQGRHYLSQPLSKQGIETYTARVESGELDPYDTLSRREREVFHLAAEGSTSNEIAQRLAISPRTVEVYRSNVMRKLRLKSRAELVRYAIRRGTLSANS